MAEINAYAVYKLVGDEKPLIHHITNWVTIYDCAQVTRTIGALPVMAHAPEEVEQMAGISDALVLNIGTLTRELIGSMVLAGKAANKKGIPVILDAVGAGATKFRTDKTKELLNFIRIDIVKGNAGELATIAGVKSQVRGVESVSVSGDRTEIAKRVAKENNCIAVITGKQDIIADAGGKVYLVDNGHELMGKIVGTGCMAASVIASFAAVERDYAKASAAALCCYGIAGELAAKSAGNKGPGSFKQSLFDELANLGEAKIKRMSRVKSSL
ncbi:Hydroxyethylthiazole kinase [Candidatus Gugararchaeum adminiculabundum]|nr:Hydroxyethylthiazole kinase [Candidatus Gugararchaeum adminiculabundum]